MGDGLSVILLAAIISFGGVFVDHWSISVINGTNVNLSVMELLVTAIVLWFVVLTTYGLFNAWLKSNNF